jgi:thioredoxin reductase (NADPH)
MHACEVAIIGAGPAGITAAVQLQRYGIEPVIFEQDIPGGLLREAHLVENYPGFPGGIPGKRLAALFFEQAIASGIAIRHERVTNLDYADGIFQIETENGSMGATVAVIASGTRPRKLEDTVVHAGAEDKIHSSVLPLLAAHDQTIAIVGVGDAAFDYALRLSERNTVVILNRGEETKCLPLLRKRAEEAGKITRRDCTRIETISPDGGGLTLMGQERGRTCSLSVDRLLLAIGREPCLGFLGENLSRHQMSLLSKNRLHIIGDAANGIYRQTAIAAGDGMRAAMKIYRYIKGDAI